MKWKDIKNDMMARIQRGDYRDGRPLEAMTELAKMYNVSLITVRRAHQDLVKSNIINSTPGKGTFITPKMKSPPIKLLSHFNEKEGTQIAFRINSEIVNGINMEAQSIGADIAFWSSLKMLDSLSPGDQLIASGAIVGSDPVFREELKRVTEEKELTVAIARTFSRRKDFSYVFEDLPEGFFDLTNYALSKGHKRIGVILDGMNTPWSKLKFDGYYRSLTENGIPIDFALIKEAKHYKFNDVDAFNELLAMPDPPSAIFVRNDLNLIPIIHECSKRGIKIPNDIALAGFNNFSEGSTMEPSITTMDSNWTELGRETVRLLDKLSGRGKSKGVIHSSVKPTLIKRESL